MTINQEKHSLSSGFILNIYFQNFCAGDASYFLMSTDKDLGELYCVRVWHDNSGKGADKSWYLTRIVIVDLATGKW